MARLSMLRPTQMAPVLRSRLLAGEVLPWGDGAAVVPGRV